MNIDRIINILLVACALVFTALVSFVIYTKFFDKVELNDLVVRTGILSEADQVTMIKDDVKDFVASGEDFSLQESKARIMAAINSCNDVDDVYSCREEVVNTLKATVKENTVQGFLDVYYILKRAGVSRAMLPMLNEMFEKQEPENLEDRIWIATKIAGIHLSFFDDNRGLEAISEFSDESSILKFNKADQKELRKILMRVSLNKKDNVSSQKHFAQLSGLIKSCSNPNISNGDLFIWFDLATYHSVRSNLDESGRILKECYEQKAQYFEKQSERKRAFFHLRASYIYSVAGRLTQAKVALEKGSKDINWLAQRDRLWKAFTQICLLKEENKTSAVISMVEEQKQIVNKNPKLYGDTVDKALDSLLHLTNGEPATYNTIFNICFIN